MVRHRGAHRLDRTCLRKLVWCDRYRGSFWVKFQIERADVPAQRHVAEQPPDADPVTFADTCCGKCMFGTCYVDQMTGA